MVIPGGCPPPIPEGAFLTREPYFVRKAGDKNAGSHDRAFEWLPFRIRGLRKLPSALVPLPQTNTVFVEPRSRLGHRRHVDGRLDPELGMHMLVDAVLEQ